MCASVCGDALRIEHAIKVTTSPLLTHMFTGITKQQVVVRPSSNEGHKISLSPVVILPRLSPPPPPRLLYLLQSVRFCFVAPNASLTNCPIQSHMEGLSVSLYRLLFTPRERDSITCSPRSICFDRCVSS